MQIVPKLLRLTWFGFPLHYSKTGKWGFLVKKVASDSEKLTKYPEDYQVFDDSSESDDKNSESSELECSSNFPYE